MKKRTVKAVLAAAMAAATVIGGAAPTAAARAAETDSAGTESGIELIPVPKEMSADGTEHHGKRSGRRCGYDDHPGRVG